MSVADAPVLEADFLAERAAKALDDGALDLGLQVGGVLNRAAFECLANVLDPHAAPASIETDFDRCGYVGSFLRPACQTHAPLGCVAQLVELLGEAKPLGHAFEDGAQSRIFHVGQAELQRAHASCRGQLVHEGFACKNIGGRGQTTVGALTQRRVARQKPRAAIRDLVRRRDRGGSGVVVREVPRLDDPLCVQTGLDFDESGRTVVRPGELFLPRPAKRDRPSRLPGEPCRFHGDLTGMLAAESASSVGDDDPHLFRPQVEGGREL